MFSLAWIESRWKGDISYNFWTEIQNFSLRDTWPGAIRAKDSLNRNGNRSTLHSHSLRAAASVYTLWPCGVAATHRPLWTQTNSFMTQSNPKRNPRRDITLCWKQKMYNFFAWRKRKDLMFGNYEKRNVFFSSKFCSMRIHRFLGILLLVSLGYFKV